MTALVKELSSLAGRLDASVGLHVAEIERTLVSVAEALRRAATALDRPSGVGDGVTTCIFCAAPLGDDFVHDENSGDSACKACGEAEAKARALDRPVDGERDEIEVRTGSGISSLRQPPAEPSAGQIDAALAAYKHEGWEEHTPDHEIADRKKRMRAALIAAGMTARPGVEEIARTLCKVDGRDPDGTDVMFICGPKNDPLPCWHGYVEQAEAIAKLMESSK